MQAEGASLHELRSRVLHASQQGREAAAEKSGEITKLQEELGSKSRYVIAACKLMILSDAFSVLHS